MENYGNKFECLECQFKFETAVDLNFFPHCPQCGSDEKTSPIEPAPSIQEEPVVRRLQRKRNKGWRMPKNTVYVGRPTKWGNPFVIGYEAFRFSANIPFPIPQNTEEVLANYRHFVEVWIAISPDWIKELRGKNLACWCKLDEPCHADILLEIANA